VQTAGRYLAEERGAFAPDEGPVDVLAREPGAPATAPLAEYVILHMDDDVVTRFYYWRGTLS
jgi:hypothetical protein